MTQLIERGRANASAKGERVQLPNDQESSGRSFGPEELELLREVLNSGTLTSTKGTMVRRLEQRFAEILEVPYVRACSSGTTAVHAAIAAVDPEPGSEIITTPITDMGALSPIIFQTAIPVFADVDPVTGNVTAATVEDRISDRTRAIVVTHLFGNPVADLAEIRELANAHGVPLIEDCAQAFLAAMDGQPVGTWGDIGCFSLQQGKHITCGEGGLTVTSDQSIARHLKVWIDKAWPYGEANPDHEFLAMNGRLSELQGAVALAQMDKLSVGVKRRIEMAARLSSALEGLPGLTTPKTAATARNVFWRYPVLIDPEIIEGGPQGVAADLGQVGIGSAPRYIQKPAFQCKVIADQRTFGESRFPFSLARPEAVDYSPERFPGVFDYLDQVLVLPWNERFEAHHLDSLATALSESILSRVGRAA
jgi:perosamine synthetase